MKFKIGDKVVFVKSRAFYKAEKELIGQIGIIVDRVKSHDAHCYYAVQFNDSYLGTKNKMWNCYGDELLGKNILKHIDFKFLND